MKTSIGCRAVDVGTKQREKGANGMIWMTRIMVEGNREKKVREKIQGRMEGRLENNVEEDDQDN